MARPRDGLDDRESALLERSAAQLRAAGTSVFARALDLSDSGAIEATMDEIESQFGAIEHLAHIAGILRVGACLQFDPDDREACMSINARAVFIITRAVAARMHARRRGSIIAVGSNAASTPRVDMAACTASKAAASQYLRCLALELAPHGVRCNIVSPGSTDTAMQGAFANDEPARRQILMGASGRP